MDHRSRNVSKSTSSYHSSLERLFGQRVSTSGDQQHAQSSSLERQHRHRTGNSNNNSSSTSQDRQHVGSSSLERLHRHRTAMSPPEQSRSGSLERHHRHRTAVSPEQMLVRASSLEHQHRHRTGVPVDWPSPMQQVEAFVLGDCILEGGDLHRRSPKEGKESAKKSKRQGSSTDKKVEELRNQLEEERLTSRRTIARLQRDIARLKSERSHNQRDGREAVVKELERERMLRVDTETRLQDMRVESDSCRARLHALQDEFRKMEEMVRDMMQYKTKIDQLKQEKANLGVTYENNLQKCRNHISTLERENMMLLNQVKKMESQIHGKGDDRDKSRLLLERLKMVEAENSGLVLENEQQRQQYEKCLDQIANQVVQALLAQKTLREECMKLQNRVHDLELQNRQLNLMFQQRVRFPSDPTMQHMPYVAGSSLVFRTESGQGEATSAQFLQGSAVSLQSMFSEAMFDDAPGHPQMSTPPPWLRDRLELPLDDEVSLSSSSTGSPASPSHAPSSTKSPRTPPSSSSSTTTTATSIPGVKTKIETEFPATNSSPKMKHVNVYERGTRSLERRGGFCPLVHAAGPSRGSTGSVRKSKIRRSSDSQQQQQGPSTGVNQLSEQAWRKLEAQVKSQAMLKSQKSSSAVTNSSAGTTPAAASQQSLIPRKESPASAAQKSKASTAAKASPSQRRSPITSASQKTRPLPAPPLSSSSTSSPSLSTQARSTSTPTTTTITTTSSRTGVSSGKNADAAKGKGKISPPASKAGGGAGEAKTSPTGSSSNGSTKGSRLPTFGKVKLRKKGPAGGRDSSQSPQRQAARNSMPPSLPPFHGQYYYDYSDEDSDSRPVSRVYSCASTVSLNELLDTSGDCDGGDFAVDDDFFSDWSSMGLSPQHRLPILPSTNPHFRPAQVQSLAYVRAVSQTASGGSNNGGASGSPQANADGGGGAEQRPAVLGVAKAERDDSGCEVEPSQSERSEKSSQAKSQGCQEAAGKDGNAQSSASSSTNAVSAGDAANGGHPEKRLSLPTAEGPGHPDLSSKRLSDSSAVLCTVSVTSKSATAVQLPSPQAAVLIAQSDGGESSSNWSIAGRGRSCENSPTSESSCGVLSPDRPPSSGGSSSKEDSVSGLRTPASEMPFSSDLIASVISREAYGCVPKLKSQPLSSDEKNSRVCRPDQLILAPSDKTFSVHGFTSSSSSSCEDKSPMKLPQSGAQRSGSGAAADGSVESSPGSTSKPKKTPPPVPHKPGKGNKAASDVGGSGKFPPETTLTVGFMSMHPQQLEHPDTVRDFVNSLVKDMKERVARNSDWPITGNSSKSSSASAANMTTTANCKSLDSSFESLRAERSGSKDDGYSTMSSDILPVAMEKYSYPETAVSAASSSSSCSKQGSVETVVGASTTMKASSDGAALDPQGKAELLKTRDKSIEMSETDSAMETSAHSMDTRNSSQSLSSQVSSSSGENVLSPIGKVTKMACFFEDEASTITTNTTTTTTPTQYHHPRHTYSAGTPSPLSPSACSSVGSPDSPRRLCSISSVTRQLAQSQFHSDTSCQNHLHEDLVPPPPPVASGITLNSDYHVVHHTHKSSSVSIMSQSSAGHTTVTSSTGMPASSVCSTNCVSTSSSSAVTVSVSSASSTTAALSNSVGMKIQSMVQNFQAGLESKTTTTTTVSHSASVSSQIPHAQRPSDLRCSPERTSRASMRATICDFRKYEITDMSKLNPCHNPPAVSAATRRENVVSWPPAKSVVSPYSPLLPTPGEYSPSYSPRWESAASPLYMILEDKLLDDIPEESGDEWDSYHVSSSQEQQQQHHHHQSHISHHHHHQHHSQPVQQQRAPEAKSVGKVSSRTSGEKSSRCLMKKAKSEGNLSEKPLAMSLYDEMMSGSWDSGKVLERSASVSEVDFRSRSVFLEERVLLHRSFRRISFDENDINQRVAVLLGKPTTSGTELSEGEVKAKKQLNDLWNTLVSQHPRNISMWRPKETAEALKEACTPSPTSIKKMDGSGNPEDWLLSFTREDIQKHTSKSCTPRAKNQPAPQGKYITGWDLSHCIPDGGDEEDKKKKKRDEAADQSGDADGGAVGAKDGGEEDSSEEGGGPTSPSEEQKLFHREFYSLCLVESNRSLASSNCSVNERSVERLNEIISANGPSGNSFQARLPNPTQVMEGVYSREFDEISHQIASLSRTVDELNRSLNSLNSEGGSRGSTQDLLLGGAHKGGDAEEEEEAEDGGGEGGGGGGATGGGGGAWSASRQECVEGYHWVEDEFYLTTCGGEVIIGSAALLAEEEGMEDYEDDGAGEEGGMFAMEDNDDAIADDAQDDFYCIRMPPRNSRRSGGGGRGLPTRPVSGGSDSDHILSSLAQFRYNSDGQLARQQQSQQTSNRGGLGIGWNMETSSSHNSLSQVLKSSTLTSAPAKTAAADDQMLADPEHRANLLDSMLPSGESNDSLSSDIGLDHMMCQRLMGRKGKMEVVRFSAPKPRRPAMDLPQFFVHYGKPEQDAVAAFDFLEEMSTASESNENVADGSTRRCRSSSQPLSRDVVLRQAQASRGHHKQQGGEPRAPRPLSESDFMKFRLPQNSSRAEAEQQMRHPSFHCYQPARREKDSARKRNGDGAEPSGTATPPNVPQRRHKLRRRRKKSDGKDRGKEAATPEGGASWPSPPDAAAAARSGSRRLPTSRAGSGGRGSRGRKAGEKLRREWHDIKVGDTVANTLSLSDSCCDSSSSSSPSVSHTDLSKF